MGSRSVALAYARNQVNQLTTQTVSITDPTATLTPNSFLLHPSATSSTAYAPNNLNQYNTVAGISKGYDLNGNLTSDGTYAYEYDEENRLRSATGAGNSIAYDYDPLERRRAKTVNGTMTRFLSDDQEEIGEYTSTPSLLRRYINGHSIDEHLVQVEAAGTHYYFQVNHQGTTLLTSDTSATPVLTSFRYGAYGDSDSPATGAAFRYTGRRLDPETGLYYYRARYYSSTLGRFLQTDPIGSADDLNLYAYTGNDPVDATDPDGREIRLQSHPVGLGNNHSKITIIPKNQSRYRHDARFKNKLPDGRVYATIGAGPERPIPGAMGHLIAGVDRERDVKQDKLQSNEKLTLPNGMSEDAAIDALFSDEAAYRNDLDYALFPDKGKDEYNSNGFANSLLKAAGFGGYKQPPSTPGWRVLLPPGEFRKPVITVIECPNGVCAK